MVIAALPGFADVLRVLGAGVAPSALDVAQRPAVAMLQLDAFADAFTLALVVFGAHLLLVGVLLVRSRLVPRVLGVLVVAGGAAYVVDGAIAVLFPDLRASVTPVLSLLGLAELALALWLLVRGIATVPREVLDTTA